MNSQPSTSFIADDWNDVSFEELEKQFFQLPEELPDKKDLAIEDPDDFNELYKMYSAVVFPYDSAQIRAISSASQGWTLSTLTPTCDANDSVATIYPQATKPSTVNLHEDIPQTEWQTESSASTPTLSYSAASSPAGSYECSTIKEGRLPTPDSDVFDTYNAASIKSKQEQDAEDPRRMSTLAARKRKRAVVDDDEYADELSGSRQISRRKRKHIRRLDDDDEPSQSSRKRSENTTRSRDWKCTYTGCSHATSSRTDLERHHLTHEPKKNFCKHPKCNKKLFSRIDALRRHVSRCHPDDSEVTLIGKV